MRLTILGLALAATSIGCLAQNWEIGGAAGAGWALDSSVTGGASQVHVGHAPSGAFGVTSDENMYNYIGGEFQYFFRTGGTQLKSNGITESASGYSNILVYDLMIHMAPRESKFRPFVGVGSGIKIYTNSAPTIPQPLSGIAFLAQGTQVEPAVSFDGGLKYMLPHHAQLRLDLRVYATPTPDLLVRAVGPSHIRGWIFDLVPTVGIGYIF